MTLDHYANGNQSDREELDHTTEVESREFLPNPYPVPQANDYWDDLPPSHYPHLYEPEYGYQSTDDYFSWRMHQGDAIPGVFGG